MSTNDDPRLRVGRDAFGNRRLQASTEPGPERAQDAARRRARFVLGPSRRYGGAVLPLIGALAVAGAVVAGVWKGGNANDPHWTEATEILEDYEFARDPDTRNYDHPVYERALDKLSRVDPASSSYDDARRLADRIERAAQAFHTQRREQHSSAVERGSVIQREHRSFEATQRVLSDVNRGAVTRHVCEEESNSDGSRSARR